MALRAASYPVIVGGLVLAALGAMRAGVPIGVAVAGSIALAGLASFLLERWIPYRSDWVPARPAVLLDVAYAVLSGVAAEVGRWVGAHAVLLSLWPAALPALVQLPLALIVAELPVYLLHRAEHRVPALWRWHALHHTPDRLYWLAAARNHPLESALTGLLYALPLALLGVPAEVLGLTLAVVGIHTWLQHANADLRLGPFTQWISSPAVHRWHHSTVLAESDANFGQTLLVWDWVFGSLRVPVSGRPDSGLAPGQSYPTGLWTQLAAPFIPSLWRAPPPTPSRTTPQ